MRQIVKDHWLVTLVLAILLILVATVRFGLGLKPTPRQRPATVLEMVEGILDHKKRTNSNVAEVPPELTKVIETDPDKVMVCLVIVKARNWPGISAEDEGKILKKKSKDALEDLRRVLHNGVTQQMKKGNYDPEKEGRHFWNNNNRATALLFVELPLAERLGKTKQFLTQELEGYREKRTEWYTPELNFDQHWGWYSSAKWPFKDEEAPNYKP